MNIIPIPDQKWISAWTQPQRENITVDDTHALMSEYDLSLLSDYSHSQPSGVWVGKMWRKQIYDLNVPTGIWKLCWFGIEDDPGYLTNHYREILIA